MEENIRFNFVTKDGAVHRINVSGVSNLVGAVLEIAQSFIDGAMGDIKPDDIVQFTDVPG